MLLEAFIRCYSERFTADALSNWLTIVILRLIEKFALCFVLQYLTIGLQENSLSHDVISIHERAFRNRIQSIKE